MTNVSQSIGDIDPLLRDKIFNPKTLLAETSTRTISLVSKEGTSSQTDNVLEAARRLVLRIDFQNKEWIVKYFFPNKISRKLFYSYIKTDPLKNAILVQQQLRNTPVRTAKIEYWARPQKYDFSVSLQQPINHNFAIAKFLQSVLTNSKNPKVTASELIIWLASQLAEMHNHNFFHGDIKPSNMFVDPNSEYGIGSLVWVDLDRSKVCSFLSREQRVNNLYHMARYFILPLSPGKLELFIDDYCKKSATLSINSNKLFQLVSTRYNKEISKIVKRGGTKSSLTTEDLVFDFTKD